MLGTALLFVALLLSNQNFEQKGGSVIGGGQWVAKQQTNKQVVFLTQNNIHPPSEE